jgi:hypothetical protein
MNIFFLAQSGQLPYCFVESRPMVVLDCSPFYCETWPIIEPALQIQKQTNFEIDGPAIYQDSRPQVSCLDK